MNVSLTPELEAFVHEKVATGRYSSASEVIRESLRLLEEKDWSKESINEEIRAEIMKGIEESSTGRVRIVQNEDDRTKLIAEIKQRGRQMTKQVRAKN